MLPLIGNCCCYNCCCAAGASATAVDDGVAAAAVIDACWFIFAWFPCLTDAVHVVPDCVGPEEPGQPEELPAPLQSEANAVVHHGHPAHNVLVILLLAARWRKEAKQ